MTRNVVFGSILFLLPAVVFSQAQRTRNLADELIHVTTRLTIIKDTIVKGVHREKSNRGSGFFYSFGIDKTHLPVIITNKHVSKDAKITKLIFTVWINDSTPDFGKTISYDNYNIFNPWIEHPNEDLAILPLKPIIDGIQKMYHKSIYYKTLDDKYIPKAEDLKGISSIEEVLMIGYPAGDWDSINNLPIVRKGLTATPFYIDYQNKKQFLLDIPSIEGSSGSPVFIFDRGAYSNDKGIMFGTRLLFLGVSTMSKQMPTKLMKVPEQDTIAKKFYIKIPIDIGVAIKSEVLMDFVPILRKKFSL